ncbi:MAG TPA: CPBP family intramembrane glutamic endopeptidase [Dokdonella sp.]|nr:CPBP family intramembrane glutamic endopeptidase [Dokdonella sp.]
MTSPLVVQAPRERVGLPLMIALVFLLSWPSTIPQVVASWRGAAAVPGWMRWLQLLLVAPGLVAIWAAWANGGGAGARALLGRLLRWRARASVYAAVLLGPPIVMLASIAASRMLGFAGPALPDAGTVAAAFGPTFLVYLLLNTEELAWRGYVLPRLQARWTPLRAALVLGAVWIVFHAPYFFMQGGHPGGYTPWLFVLQLLPVSILLARTFNASAGSVLLPHLLHQSINAWAEALPFLPRFAGSMAPVVASIVIAFAIAGLAIAARPPMWRRLPPS